MGKNRYLNFFRKKELNVYGNNMGLSVKFWDKISVECEIPLTNRKGEAGNDRRPIKGSIFKGGKKSVENFPFGAKAVSKDTYKNCYPI